MPLGLTFYFKWPCLERFLVENKNPRETSGLENGVQNFHLEMEQNSVNRHGVYKYLRA